MALFTFFDLHSREMTGCCLPKSCCSSVRCLTYSPTTISNNTLKCKGEKYKGSRTKNKDKADFQIDSININKEQHATVSDFSAQPRLNQFRGRGARAGAAEPVRMKLPERLIPSEGGETWVMPGINLLPVGIWDCWLPTHPLCPAHRAAAAGSCGQWHQCQSWPGDRAQGVSCSMFGVFLAC